MVSNAAMMYGMMPNTYYNQVALNDLTNMNVSYPVGLGMDPMFSMNSSIFPGGMGYGMNYGMNCGMGYPYMPTFGGNGNIEDYYKNIEKYDDFMLDRQVRREQRVRNANLQLSSPGEGIQKQAELLHEKILQDEQEQIKIAYDQYIDSVKAMYGDATKEQIENRADSLYKQIHGVTVHDDIRKNGKGSFTQGFLQTLTFGLADGKTAEENISTLTGLPVSRTEDSKKFAGNIAGGAAVGGLTTVATVPLLKALKIGAKNRTMWGIFAGAAVGLLTALTTSK